jgi:hypothetical protein
MHLRVNGAQQQRHAQLTGGGLAAQTSKGKGKGKGSRCAGPEPGVPCNSGAGGSIAAMCSSQCCIHCCQRWQELQGRTCNYSQHRAPGQRRAAARSSEVSADLDLVAPRGARILSTIPMQPMPSPMPQVQPRPQPSPQAQVQPQVQPQSNASATGAAAAGSGVPSGVPSSCQQEVQRHSTLSAPCSCWPGQIK